MRQKFGRHITPDRKRALIKEHIKDYNIPTTNQPKRIIIVGAGFAGCYAGWLLSQAGHKVKILEATSRVGGRVKSSYGWPKGRVIEIGAEFINGFDSHW